MTHATVCATHGIILDQDRAAHARLHARAKTKQRKASEPWRSIYTTRAWKYCLKLALKRDGYQCRIIERDGQRCTETTNLEGHHTQPLHQLYHTLNRTMFYREATNPEHVVTVCRLHHRALERQTP